MTTMEDVELLKAAIAVAVADGTIRRSEKGVLQGLAMRVGVGRMSFQAMVDAAEREGFQGDDLLIRSKDKARQAFELLVAQARIDGEISDEERSLLVQIGQRLNITGDEFGELYTAGIRRADDIRRSRKGGS
jgi:tellurite resistance protein